MSTRLPKHKVGSSPRHQRLRLGFVPLVDCAPLVVARELGFFAKQGVEVVLNREVGWATIRDKIIYQELEMAHAPAGMGYSITCGFGSIVCECVAGLVLNLQGDAITLSTALWEAGVRDASTLGALIRSGKLKRKLVLGTVYAYSSHSYLMREWLRQGGINPDTEVRLIQVPPAQMTANLEAGNLDGFCVGEPWNSAAICTGAGWCPVTSAEIDPLHPEKILLARRDFVERNESTYVAVITALLEACQYCDRVQNAGMIAEWLARPAYLNCPRKIILASLTNRFDYGAEQKRTTERFHLFHHDNANEPGQDKAQRVLTQLKNCLLPEEQKRLTAALAKQVFRSEYYQQALRKLASPAASSAKRTDFTLPNPDSKPIMQPTNHFTQNHAQAGLNHLSRRQFLGRLGTGLTAGALLAGMPKGWMGSVYASDAPEVADMKFGMIALTDCAPIVMAHEKGLFKKYGINSTVIKGASWAAIRDNLAHGDIQATHMLLGMPIASTMGLGGGAKVSMVIPWIMDRNGQAITVKSDFKGKVNADPKTLKPFVDAAKASGTPLTFAVTFPPGTHAMWTRYWLAAGGINPDKDITLIVVPPAQMIANMKIGKMDGFCVGEPWGARAIAENTGYTATTTQEIWKDHPEKVCAFTADFADKNPKTVKAVLKALHEASTYSDVLANRPELAATISATTYVNCKPEIILPRLQGHYDYGDGRVTQDPYYMIFHDRSCNYPQLKYATWTLSQFRRWGMTTGAPDYAGIAKQIMRTDLYEEAMKEVGYTRGAADNKPETLFDGITFDPADPEKYATSFAINNLK